MGVFLHNRTFIMLLIKAEMMYMGINLLFVASSLYFMEMAGFMYSLVLFGVVAAESVIGLSLFFFLLLTDTESVLYDLSDILDQ
jgi:NADH:ubiquinone oxidoreductase subunit K